MHNKYVCKIYVYYLFRAEEDRTSPLMWQHIFHTLLLEVLLSHLSLHPTLIVQNWSAINCWHFRRECGWNVRIFALLFALFWSANNDIKWVEFLQIVNSRTGCWANLMEMWLTDVMDRHDGQTWWTDLTDRQTWRIDMTDRCDSHSFGTCCGLDAFYVII